MKNRKIMERTQKVMRDPNLFIDYAVGKFFYPHSMEKSGAEFKQYISTPHNIKKGLLNKFPWFKTTIARMNNIRVLYPSKCFGRINVNFPQHSQINKGSQVSNVTVQGDRFVLIDNDVQVQDKVFVNDAIVTKNNFFPGKRVENPFLFFTIDLEGTIGLEQNPNFSKFGWDKIDATFSANKVCDLLIKYQIPATWFTCGHLFLEGNNRNRYMPKFIERLKDNDLFEIGYHTFSHFLYIDASDETILKDIEEAKKIRKEWGISLESFSFPCNEISRIDLLLNGGFKYFRGLIGSSGSFGLSDFGKFFLLQSSFYVYPRFDLNLLAFKGNQSSSIITHDYNWGINNQLLEEVLIKIKELKEDGIVFLKKMSELR